MQFVSNHDVMHLYNAPNTWSYLVTIGTYKQLQLQFTTV